MDVLIRQNRIGDIRTLVLTNIDGTLGKPMVILYHGYVGQKEMILPHAYYLATHGFFVVLPDAYGHGERYFPDRVCGFFEAVEQTTGEINQIIEYYRSNTAVDTERTGLAGFSMGGCITFNYLAVTEKKIKAAAAVIASPDWVSVMKTPDAFTLFKSVRIVNCEEDMKSLVDTALDFQPVNNYENMTGIPLLIQNGAEDTLIPVTGVQDLYEKLKPLYANPNELQLIVYPGVGHGETPYMVAKLTEWFKKHL